MPTNITIPEFKTTITSGYVHIDSDSPFWAWDDAEKIRCLSELQPMMQECADLDTLHGIMQGGDPKHVPFFVIIKHKVRQCLTRILHSNLAGSNDRHIARHWLNLAHSEATRRRHLRTSPPPINVKISPRPDNPRRIAYLRDGGRCRYCGREVRYEFHLDHVIPKSIGGPNTAENLVVACVPCNLKKAGRTPAEAGMVLMPSQAEILSWVSQLTDNEVEAAKEIAMGVLSPAERQMLAKSTVKTSITLARAAFRAIYKDQPQ